MCQVLNSLSRAQNIVFLDVFKVTVFLTVLFILNNGLINEQKKTVWPQITLNNVSGKCLRAARHYFDDLAKDGFTRASRKASFSFISMFKSCLIPIPFSSSNLYGNLILDQILRWTSLPFFIQENCAAMKGRSTYQSRIQFLKHDTSG